MEKLNVKKTNRKKKLIIGISVAAILAIAAIIGIALIALSINNKKPIAAFYGLTENQKVSLESQLQTTLERRKTGNHLPYEIITLNPNVPLEQAINESGKTPDLIFTKLGLNAENLAAKSLDMGFGLDKNELDVVSNSIQGLAIEPYAKGKTIAAVPLLTDHYQMDINTEQYQKSSVHRIADLDDLETFLSIAKKMNQQNAGFAPIIFAGGDNAELLNVLQVLTEASGDMDNVKAAKILIREETQKAIPDYVSLAKQLVSNGGLFYKAAQLLKKWDNMGYLPENYLQFQKSEVSFYMETNLTCASILPLSLHRTIKHNVLMNYTTIYMPGISENMNRSFIAPVIGVIPYGNKNFWERFVSLFVKNKSLDSVKQFLNDQNGSIAGRTMLAPVNKTAITVDKQANDTRFWIAASGTPSLPLSDDCFLWDEKLSKLANELRFMLK